MRHGTRLAGIALLCAVVATVIERTPSAVFAGHSSLGIISDDTGAGTDGSFGSLFVGSSSDGSRMFFTTDEALLPAVDTDTAQNDVYEQVGGVLTLVSDDTGGGTDGALSSDFT